MLLHIVFAVFLNKNKKGKSLSQHTETDLKNRLEIAKKSHKISFNCCGMCKNNFNKQFFIKNLLKQACFIVENHVNMKHRFIKFFYS